jgi:hypothetical protein
MNTAKGEQMGDAAAMQTKAKEKQERNWRSTYDCLFQRP